MSIRMCKPSEAEAATKVDPPHSAELLESACLDCDCGEQRLTFNAETHSYYFDGEYLPSVTQILEGAGLIDFSGVPEFVLDFAADRGRKVHKALELHDHGDLDEDRLDERLRPYLEAYKRFRADTGFVPTLIEKRVCNPSFRYAGTLDRTGAMNGSHAPILVDFKSGCVDDWVALQLVAYANCLDGGARYRRFALQLRRDATYRIREYEPRHYLSDWNDFLAAMRVAARRIQGKRERVIA